MHFQSTECVKVTQSSFKWFWWSDSFQIEKIVIFKQALHFKQVNLEHFDKLNEYTLFCLSFTRH